LQKGINSLYRPLALYGGGFGGAVQGDRRGCSGVHGGKTPEENKSSKSKLTAGSPIGRALIHRLTAGEMDKA
jgi:hypothetical protein